MNTLEKPATPVASVFYSARRRLVRTFYDAAPDDVGWDGKYIVRVPLSVQKEIHGMDEQELGSMGLRSEILVNGLKVALPKLLGVTAEYDNCHETDWIFEEASQPIITKMRKTLDVQDINDATKKVSDIQVVGNGDSFQLLCKASSKEQGWMKSCKAMEIPGVGCLVQVTTQQCNNVAEALTFIPGVVVLPDVNGGRKLYSAFAATPTPHDVDSLNYGKATCERECECSR
jgi:hypothetical protein